MKTVSKSLILIIPSGLIVVAALMISGLYREIDSLNIKLEQLNTTQTSIINWINVRQEPFNTDVITWANNTSTTIAELKK